MSLMPEDEISSISNATSFTSRRHRLRKASRSPFPSDTIPPSYSASSSTTTFSTVSLHKFDRIRFFQFPPSDWPRLVEIVASAWSNGIQTTREYAGSYEIQLKGNPWMHSSSTTVLGDNHSRRLIRLLFEGLYEMGWVFETAVRACRKPTEKDTLIFAKNTNSHPLPPLQDWFMISYDNYNLITVQRAPQNFTQILSQRLNGITTITNMTEDDSHAVLQVKGALWIASGTDTMKVRAMLLAVRETLEMCGCRIYASIRMMNTEDDVLVCCRVENGRRDMEREQSYEKGDLI